MGDAAMSETKSRIEELEGQLAKKRADREKAEAAQYEKDLEARLALEDEHGGVVGVQMPRHVPGQPTRAYLRTPNPSEYKRFKDRLHRSLLGEKKNVAEQQAAAEQLGRACWIYPASDEDKSSMLDAFPGLLTSISNAAAQLAEGKREDEGNG